MNIDRRKSDLGGLATEMAILIGLVATIGFGAVGYLGIETINSLSELTGRSMSAQGVESYSNEASGWGDLS